MIVFPCPNFTQFPPRSHYLVTRNASGCLVEFRPRWRSPGGNALFRGDWLPSSGYASMAFSCRTYLAACATFWKNILTPAERATWGFAIPPYRTRFETWVAWQKYNEPLKMVNPRIDLWDGFPPYITAPGIYAPPSLHLTAAHMYITPPGAPKSALQIDMQTTPAHQWVLISSTAFYRRPGATTQPRSLNNFDLVEARQTPPANEYRVIRNFIGDAVQFAITEPTDATGLRHFNWRPRWAGASAGGTLTNDPTAPWLTWDNATYPAAPAGFQDIPFTVDLDTAPQPGGSGNLTFQFTGQNYNQLHVNTPIGDLVWWPEASGFHAPVGIAFATFPTDCWEYARHVIGMPRAGSRCIIRLLAVDKTTGSPGQQQSLYVVAE